MLETTKKELAIMISLPILVVKYKNRIIVVSVEQKVPLIFQRLKKRRRAFILGL